MAEAILKSITTATKVPPAVERYRGVALAYPNKAQWPAMAEAVGEEEADLDRWADTVEAYILQGWNPVNVAGMLAYYKRGELPMPGKSDSGSPRAGEFQSHVAPRHVSEQEGRSGQVVKNADGSFYV